MARQVSWKIERLNPPVRGVTHTLKIKVVETNEKGVDYMMNESTNYMTAQELLALAADLPQLVHKA